MSHLLLDLRDEIDNLFRGIDPLFDNLSGLKKKRSQ